MSNITQINDVNTTADAKKVSKPSINDLIKRPLHKLFPNDPTKLTWSSEPPRTVAEEKAKNRALFSLLKGEDRRRKLDEWRDAETNFEIDDEYDDISELSDLLDDLNRRARGVYEARRIKIIRKLTGDVSGDEIEEVRIDSRLSAEKLKQALTTGTVKEGNSSVSNGVPVDGIEQSTLDYLDAEIEKGKQAARRRAEKAAENKAVTDAIKSGEEDFEVEAAF